MNKKKLAVTAESSSLVGKNPLQIVTILLELSPNKDGIGIIRRLDPDEVRYIENNWCEEGEDAGTALTIILIDAMSFRKLTPPEGFECRYSKDNPVFQTGCFAKEAQLVV